MQAVVIGVSAGGLKALPMVIGQLPETFSVPIVVVQHLSPEGDHGFLIEYLNARSPLAVQEGVEREFLQSGHVYLAPANYHLLIEKDRTLALSVDAKVNYSRPSIDVLFESAATVYAGALIGVILTGASADGAQGLSMIRQMGGLTIVQDPAGAEIDLMPQAAIRAARPDYVVTLAGIAGLLEKLVMFQDADKASTRTT